MIKWSTKGFGRRWPEDWIILSKPKDMKGNLLCAFLDLIFHLNCVSSGRCGTPVRIEARLPRGQANRLKGPPLTGGLLASLSPVISVSTPSPILSSLILFESSRDQTTNSMCGRTSPG